MRGSGGRSTAGATFGGEASSRFVSVLIFAAEAVLSFDDAAVLTLDDGAAPRLITSSSGFKFLLPYEGPTAGALVLIGGGGFCIGGLLVGSALVAVVVTLVSEAVCALGL